MLIENLIHCITESQKSMRYTAWDVINNAVCKFFNKKSVQIVEANSHISG